MTGVISFSLFAVITASGTTAPVGSVTVPWIAAYVSCAHDEMEVLSAVKHARSNAKVKNFLIL
jgi:hypothetical protein